MIALSMRSIKELESTCIARPRSRPACCRECRHPCGRRSRSGDTAANRRTGDQDISQGPPAMLPGIGRLGAGLSHLLAAAAGLLQPGDLENTFICAATMSRVSLTSSPTGAVHRHARGQQAPGSRRLALANHLLRYARTPTQDIFSGTLATGAPGAASSAFIDYSASLSAVAI